MSNDILSGGRIDESTDGPNPPSVDDRSRNILQEQKAQQDQDAIGGSQYAPRVEPPPPIPVAPEVVPLLPAVPSFDFNVSGSVLEEVREITRQAMVDAFKNVTINGQSPSIEGSAISFTVQPQQPSASEVFSFQNGELGQASSPTANILPPQLQPMENVQSVAVPPPSRPRERAESVGEQRDRENSERESRDQEIRTSLGLSPVPPLAQPSEPSITRGRSIGEQNDEENSVRAQRDAEIRASAGLSGESPMDEESDSAMAYREAEARREERRENNPDFNPESDIRQEGETMSEYKERQEKLEQKKIEDSDISENESLLTRESSGPIAVSLTRADGQGKVFAFFRSDNSIEGEPTLPKDQYYVGGSSDSCGSLGLYFKTNGNDDATLWISQGWANGHINAQEVASSGSGFVVAETTINKSTGEDIGTIITTKQSPITDTDTKFYFIIGSYNFGGSGGTAGGSGPTVSQFHCGSIWGYSCRIDYSSPPKFSFRYYS